VLGLVRDQVLAALFGATSDMDAFIVAFRIPNLIRDLFAEGAMSAAFVPAFTRHLTSGGKPAAWRLGNNVLNLLLIMTTVLVLLGIVFARPIVTAYAAHYAAVPGKLELTIRLTRVMLPFLTLVAVAAVAMGMLNSLHHYFLPALSPAMFNVATILGAFLLVPVMAPVGLPRIMGVAIAALVGGIGQIGLQWPSLRREGYTYEAVCDPRDAGLRDVILMMGPGTIGLAATQVNVFVNTLLATAQGTGAVSWLTYAFRLMYLPIGLFGVSIGTAVLPAVSRHAAMADAAGIRNTTARGLAMMFTLNVPAAFGLMVLARPIVALLFEHGAFSPNDTAETAGALRYYAVGLVGYSAARIISPVFYALRQSRTAVLVSVATILLNVVLSVTLVRVLGFTGLALATSIAALAHGAILLVLLSRRLGGLEERRLAETLAKVVAAAVVMAVAVAAIDAGTSTLSPSGSFTMRAVRLTTSIAGGLIVLATAARLLGIDALDDALDAVRARLSR